MKFLVFNNKNGLGTADKLIVNWDSVKYIKPIDGDTFYIELNNGAYLEFDLSGANTSPKAIEAINRVVKANPNSRILEVKPRSLTEFVFSNIQYRVAASGSIDGSGVQYAIPVFTDTNTITNLAIGTTGQVLTSNGAGANPSFQTLSVPVNVTDTASGINVTSPGTQNIFIGFEAGNANTSNENTFVGYRAGVVSTGSDNTFIGNEAGRTASSGSKNTAVGHEAGENISTASSNTIVGWAAGGNNKSNSVCIGDQVTGGERAVSIGSLANAQASVLTGAVSIGYRAGYQGAETGNVAIGYEAHYRGSNEFVTAIGYLALRNLNELDEVWTTAVGYEAGYTQSGSGKNSYFGHRAGYAVTNGEENTLIGSFAGDALTTGNNNIVIGYNAAASSATVSNEITLGNASITAIRAAVTSITSLSDERDKKDIKDLTYGLDFVSKLKPREFVWDNRVEQKTFLPHSEKKEGPSVSEIVSANKGKKDFGFIAQEVQVHDDDTLRLIYDENPDKLEMSYGKLVPILVKAIQELSAKVTALENA